MPKYTVSLCAEATVWADVEVEADSPAEAEREAIAQSKERSFFWEFDNDNIKEFSIEANEVNEAGNG